MTAHVVTQAYFQAGEALGKVANVMDQADCSAINPQPRPQASLKRKALKMNRLLLTLTALLFVSCQTDTELFDDVNEMAEFDRVYKPTLIQSGKESGFLEPMMEYSLFRIDSLAFQNLENSILTSEKFIKGSYYLNIELDDYLHQNKLDILNMSKSSITDNQYYKTYRVYLLSDRKTFAICKINH